MVGCGWDADDTRDRYVEREEEHLWVEEGVRCEVVVSL